jgi:hypothetical protein
MTTRTALLLTVSLAACAPDLRDDHPFDGTGKCLDPATKAQVDCALVPLVTSTLDGKVRNMIVDATNKESKVYIDLDSAREMKTDEAFATNGWDLAFKRFEISMNGGSSNPQGAVRIAVLEKTPFDSLTQAPAEGYEQDGAQSVFSGVNGGWYYYDLGTHRLTTKDELYVIQTSDGAYVKLRMGSYYDASGTPARLSFSFEPVSAP